MKTMLSTESVKNQFRNALQDSAPLFVASLIDIFTNDKNLQECPPNMVVMEALKAATLKLPINKNLGFAYIVAYKGKPEFQMGYRGIIQLAIRTGQYKYLNAGMLYEGQRVNSDFLTGAVTISGEPKNGAVIGYFAHMELLNGFSKTLFWDKEQVTAHAKKFSKSWGRPNSPWTTNFDGMATKTMIRNLLGKYGILSVEMISALSGDTDERNPEARADEEIEREANAGDVIDVEVVPESEMQSTGTDGPSF
jgi:recombination protein RecT